MESASRDELLGQMVFDRQGKEVGEIVEVYKAVQIPVALLARVRVLGGERTTRVIPLATAKQKKDGIQAKVDLEALEGSPTIKSGKSIVVSPERVEAIYRHHAQGVPKRLKAIKTSPRRDAEILYLDLPPGVRTGKTWREILRERQRQGR